MENINNKLGFISRRGFVQDPYLRVFEKVRNDFVKDMEADFIHRGERIAVGNCELTKLPDGSISARIEFYPQNPR